MEHLLDLLLVVVEVEYTIHLEHLLDQAVTEEVELEDLEVVEEHLEHLEQLTPEEEVEVEDNVLQYQEVKVDQVLQ